MTFFLDPQQPQNAQWDTTHGRPNLTLLEDGSLLLSLDSEHGTVGQKCWWSYDNGYSWITNIDPSVAIPTGGATAFDASANDTTQGFIQEGNARRLLTRSTIAYGGGPVYTAWQNASDASLPNRLAIFQMFNWGIINKSELGNNLLSGYVPVPIRPGIPIWIGIDDVRITFSGQPAVEDTWDIDIQYRYDARNIGIESPSIHFRLSASRATP